MLVYVYRSIGPLYNYHNIINETDIGHLVPVGGVADVVFPFQFLGFCCFKIRSLFQFLYSIISFVSPRAPLFSLFSMIMIQTCRRNQVYNN